MIFCNATNIQTQNHYTDWLTLLWHWNIHGWFWNTRNRVKIRLSCATRLTISIDNYSICCVRIVEFCFSWFRSKSIWQFFILFNYSPLYTQLFFVVKRTYCSIYLFNDKYNILFCMKNFGGEFWLKYVT